MTTTTSVVTVAKSDRGNYHIALNEEPLSPLCGTKPQQRTTSIPVEQFKNTRSWYCSRCHYLHISDGKWDGS